MSRFYLPACRNRMRAEDLGKMKVVLALQTIKRIALLVITILEV